MFRLAYTPRSRFSGKNLMTLMIRKPYLAMTEESIGFVFKSVANRIFDKG
jgi:hypothetical protein